jgi:DNA processing protein
VAVLGSGLARPYPAEHAPLADAIVAGGGAVVSEFPPQAAPLPRNFPQRNRVIAGWGRAVVVVEAGTRSGALGTARAALDEGRDVMAVPGHPSEPGFEGSNRLLRDGAVLVRDAADVAEEIGLPLRRAGVTSGADPVLHLLRRDAPASLDELLARSGRPLPELLVRLAELELVQRVRRLPGALYVRA